MHRRYYSLLIRLNIPFFKLKVIGEPSIRSLRRCLFCWSASAIYFTPKPENPQSDGEIHVEIQVGYALQRTSRILFGKEVWWFLSFLRLLNYNLKLRKKEERELENSSWDMVLFCNKESDNALTCQGWNLHSKSHVVAMVTVDAELLDKFARFDPLEEFFRLNIDQRRKHWELWMKFDLLPERVKSGRSKSYVHPANLIIEVSEVQRVLSSKKLPN